MDEKQKLCAAPAAHSATIRPASERGTMSTPVDIYGTAWGQVLADVDPQALSVAGLQTIAFPDGIIDAG